MKKGITFALASFLLGANSLYSDTLEMIFYPQADFSEAIIHTNYQGDKNKNYSFLFDKGFDTNRIMYVRPLGYSVTKTKEQYTKLSFENTDRYTYLQRANKDDYLVSDNNGILKILLSGGDCKESASCVTSENILTVNIPRGYGVKSYQGLDQNLRALANPIWSQNGNSITLIAKNVKGASVMMELERLKTNAPLAKIISNNTVYAQNTVVKQPEVASKPQKIEPTIEPIKKIETNNTIQIAKVETKIDNTVQAEPKSLDTVFANFSLFDNSGINLSANGKQLLDKWAMEFKSSSYKKITINSYTDNTPLVKLKPIYGTNEVLSQHRASLVMEYLASKSISTDSMVAVGMGEANPIASNDTPEGRVENRRIELVVSK